jgi:peptidoglycan/LPS O-acetylase OafA/YrhL
MGAVRLFLALVVALDHFRDIVLSPAGVTFSPRYDLGVDAGLAVMFFFIVSGFLMSTVLGGKYPADRAGTLAFYRARFIRIFSVYWPVVLMLMIVDGPGTLREFAMQSTADQFTRLFLFGSEWRIVFASPGPHFDALPQNLHQAWTLGPELTFYLVAPFLLRSLPAAAIALVVSLVLRFAFIASGEPNTWVYMLFPATLCLFLLGHAARALAGRIAILSRPAAGYALLVLSFGVLMIALPTPWDSGRFWLAMVAFAAAMPGLFAGTKNIAVLNRLGDLSYPLYLTQFLSLGIALPYLTRMLAGGQSAAELAVVTFLAITVAIAAATHYLIERPVAALLGLALSVRLGRVRPEPGFQMPVAAKQTHIVTS